MKPIAYPKQGTAEYKRITNDYSAIYAKRLASHKATPVLEDRWIDWKRKNGCVRSLDKTVAELLIMDFDGLVDFYKKYDTVVKSKSISERQIIKLKKIFDYDNRFKSSISQFFIRHADELKIYTCHYCEMAYINVYTDKTSGKAKTHFDVDHFIPQKLCPPLALSLFNFVPSCPICNERIKHAFLPNVSLDELKLLSPSSPYFGVDKNIRIKIAHRPIVGGGTLDCVYIVSAYPYREYVNFFKLEDRYNFHKNEALRLECLKKKYSPSQIRIIARCLRRRETEVREDIFNRRFLESNHRCFAKFTRDILRWCL